MKIGVKKTLFTLSCAFALITTAHLQAQYKLTLLTDDHVTHGVFEPRYIDQTTHMVCRANPEQVAGLLDQGYDLCTNDGKTFYLSPPGLRGGMFGWLFGWTTASTLATHLLKIGAYADIISRGASGDPTAYADALKEIVPALFGLVSGIDAFSTLADKVGFSEHLASLKNLYEVVEGDPSVLCEGSEVLAVIQNNAERIITMLKDAGYALKGLGTVNIVAAVGGPKVVVIAGLLVGGAFVVKKLRDQGKKIAKLEKENKSLKRKNQPRSSQGPPESVANAGSTEAGAQDQNNGDGLTENETRQTNPTEQEPTSWETQENHTRPLQTDADHGGPTDRKGKGEATWGGEPISPSIVKVILDAIDNESCRGSFPSTINHHGTEYAVNYSARFKAQKKAGDLLQLSVKIESKAYCRESGMSYRIPKFRLDRFDVSCSVFMSLAVPLNASQLKERRRNIFRCLLLDKHYGNLESVINRKLNLNDPLKKDDCWEASTASDFSEQFDTESMKCFLESSKKSKGPRHRPTGSGSIPHSDEGRIPQNTDLRAILPDLPDLIVNKNHDSGPVTPDTLSYADVLKGKTEAASLSEGMAR